MRKTNDAGMFVELSNDEASNVVGGGVLSTIGDAFMYVVEECNGTNAAIFTRGAALDRAILVNQGRASKQPDRQ